MIEPQTTKFSKSILDTRTKRPSFDNDEGSTTYRELKVSTLGCLGTDSPRESETTPHMIIREEEDDDENFILTVDKLVSEAETLLNSHEKLQEDYIDLKSNRRWKSSSKKNNSLCANQNEDKSGETTQFSEIIGTCGCQAGDEIGDGYDTVQLVQKEEQLLDQFR